MRTPMNEDSTTWGVGKVLPIFFEALLNALWKKKFYFKKFLNNFEILFEKIFKKFCQKIWKDF